LWRVDCRSYKLTIRLLTQYYTFHLISTTIFRPNESDGFRSARLKVLRDVFAFVIWEGYVRWPTDGRTIVSYYGFPRNRTWTDGRRAEPFGSIAVFTIATPRIRASIYRRHKIVFDNENNPAKYASLGIAHNTIDTGSAWVSVNPSTSRGNTIDFPFERCTWTIDAHGSGLIQYVGPECRRKRFPLAANRVNTTVTQTLV